VTCHFFTGKIPAFTAIPTVMAYKYLKCSCCGFRFRLNTRKWIIQTKTNK
jgi:hypothetical protein